MSDGELLDAREAMSLLGINETDLQTMVARGDLRAFRSAGTMKFRRDDVMNIKTEKKTDPTIPVIPPEKPKAKPGSGILPTVATRTARASSKNLPTVRPTIPTKPAAAKAATADSGTSSDQIILEEFELAPSEVDPVTSTQQITAQQTAVPGGVTVVDNAVETGNVTVVEPGVDTVDTASATASAIAPVAVPSQQRKPSSRIAEALPAAPAMSRVRAAVSASGQSAASKRAQATAQQRTGHPIMTLVLVLTTGLLLYAATIVGVQMVAGNYNEATQQRVIPPFLTDAPLWNYRTAYDNLPGVTDDKAGTAKRPSTEYGGGK